MIGKKVFLAKITSRNQNFQPIDLKGTDFEGSSPPSIFIGRDNYPNVDAGPMLSKQYDSFIYDTPEQWLGTFKKEDIIKFRLGLLRGKQKVRVNDLSSKFAQKLQEIALSKKSLYAAAKFESVPRGTTFSEDHQPFGPSANLKHLETQNAQWQKDFEKAHYDNDLLSKDAVIDLHKKGLGFTAIQKALSVGAFGKSKNRKLVPTRWSITATDDMLGKNAMPIVRENEVIREYRVYEASGLHNYFAVLLTPTKWQYEATEAFIGQLDNKTFMFGDNEKYEGRTKYSEMGGCYYAQRFAIADHLKSKEEQAGAFVFREAYEDYTPTGVWICRELTKAAMKNEPKTFKTMQEALTYIDSKTRLGIKPFNKVMPLLQQNRYSLKYFF